MFAIRKDRAGKAKKFRKGQPPNTVNLLALVAIGSDLLVHDLQGGSGPLRGELKRTGSQ